jgi:hypothetical protein
MTFARYLRGSNYTSEPTIYNFVECIEKDCSFYDIEKKRCGFSLRGISGSRQERLIENTARVDDKAPACPKRLRTVWTPKQMQKREEKEERKC